MKATDALWVERLIDEGLVQTVAPTLPSCTCHVEVIDGVPYNFVGVSCEKHNHTSPMYVRSGSKGRIEGRRHSGVRGND